MLFIRFTKRSLNNLLQMMRAIATNFVDDMCINLK